MQKYDSKVMDNGNEDLAPFEGENWIFQIQQIG